MAMLMAIVLWPPPPPPRKTAQDMLDEKEGKKR